MDVNYKKFTVNNVRLSFPALFERAKFDDNSGDGKFEATLLLDKDENAEEIAIVEAAIAAALEDKWPEANYAAKPNTRPKVAADKRCLKDGSESSYDGYENAMSLKASNGNPPLRMAADKSKLLEDDGTFYAGCYVDAILGVWVQDNKFGKRVNSNLLAIRFRGDGEPFSGARVSEEEAANEFDDLNEELKVDDL